MFFVCIFIIIYTNDLINSTNKLSFILFVMLLISFAREKILRNSKISKIISILGKIRFYVNQPLLKMLYNSLITVRISSLIYGPYGNIVWANNYPTRVDKLLKLQKYALRVIILSHIKLPLSTLSSTF